jgi:predicted transcriptional regulator
MITKVITAHVPAPLAKRVDELAASLERSRGWIVKEALTVWVAQEEERHQWTLQAMADVDASLVVDDHQVVQAWASSLLSDTPLQVPAPVPASTQPTRNASKSRKQRKQ